MKENMQKNSKIALLMNDSHLWGLWTYQALKNNSYPIEPLLAKELDESFSYKYKALFVPGGWSKNKLESLKAIDTTLILEFLQRGGFYFGICGGASLAGEEGLKLVPLVRKKERVPSYSGPSLIECANSSLFKDIKKPIFYLWFPPEFEIKDNTLKILATFSKASPQAYCADLPLRDHLPTIHKYEKLYGIPLNPAKMQGKPLVIQGSYGKGQVLLSLIHFDTPNCKNSNIFWKNLYNLLQLSASHKIISKKRGVQKRSLHLQKVFFREFKSLYKETKELLNFALRNFLYHPRYPFFYQWKRGIRGLELLNLYYMTKEILHNLNQYVYNGDTLQRIQMLLDELKENYFLVLGGLKKDFMNFIYGEKLFAEEELISIFGENKKSYGGLYRKVINILEEALVYLWREGC